MPSIHDQQNYNYHGVETFEVRLENRSSGCWTSSSMKLIQLCCMGILLPITLLIIPLYGRFFLYNLTVIPMAETEMRLLDSNISTIWCQGQKMVMNVSFDAFLMDKQPSLSFSVKKQSMTRHFVLDDDLKEYWGFYLLKGSQLTVTSCARHLGASVMLIKGGINLNYCASIGGDSSEEDYEETEEDLIVTSNVTRNQNASDFQIMKHLSSSNENNYTIPEDDSKSVEDLGNEFYPDDIAEDRGTLVHPFLNDASSTSSSEENMRNCPGFLLTRPLVPQENCNNKTVPKGNIMKYNINIEGYYYFVFSSSFEQEGNDENPLTVKFDMLKTEFNTTDAVAVCRNSTICNFPLHFASSERVIVALPSVSSLDGISTQYRDETYFVQSECEPRTLLYLTFILSLPVLLILCALM